MHMFFTWNSFILFQKKEKNNTGFAYNSKQFNFWKYIIHGNDKNKTL